MIDSMDFKSIFRFLMNAGSLLVVTAPSVEGSINPSSSRILREYRTLCCGSCDFSASLNFDSPGSGDGFLEAYWSSPRDGSELDKVRVPVKF